MKTNIIRLFISIIWFIVLSTSVFAVTVTIPDVEGKKSETTTVPIEIDDKTGVVSIDFIVDYNDGVLSVPDPNPSEDYEPIRTTDLTPKGPDGWLIAYEAPPDSDRIKITIINSVEPIGIGAVVEIDFNVVESANVGETITLTLTQALINEGDIASTPVSGSITVVNNCDGDQISGIITDCVNPIPATVQVWRNGTLVQTVDTPDGSYVLSVPDGVYALKAYASGYYAKVLPNEITPPAE